MGTGRREYLPPIGTPLEGQHDPMAIVSDIGDMTAALGSLNVPGAQVTTGGGGIQVELPRRARLRLFEVYGSSDSTGATTWSKEDIPSTYKRYQDPTIGKWWWTRAKEVAYFTRDAKPGWHVEQTGTKYEVIWHPLQSVRDAVNETCDSTGFSVGEEPALTKGDWVWCVLEQWSGRWVVVPKYSESAPWYNNQSSSISSGQDLGECPAYGVAAQTGVHGTEPNKILQGGRPLVTIPKQYFINSGSKVAAQAHGTYQKHEWVLAAYDTGTPAMDEIWVPKADQWTLTKGSDGSSGQSDSVEEWGVWVAGIVDSTNKILLGKIIDNTAEYFKFHNSAGSTAPAYAVMGVSGVEVDIPKIDKPSGTYRANYIVNKGGDVSDSEIGRYQNHPMVEALYNSSGQAGFGELWGPTEGQWHLSKGSTGNGDANTTKTKANWGIVVAGITDTTNKVLIGRQVPYGMAKRCNAKLTAAITATTATVDVDTVVATSVGWAPVSSSSDVINAHIRLNPTSGGGWVGADNTDCGIEYHEDDSYWWIYDMACASGQ